MPPTKTAPIQTAPNSPVLSQAQVDSYHTNGYLVLPDFVSHQDCLKIRQRACEIVDQFDPGAQTSVFSTTRQSHAQDDYFMDSAYDVRCFLETGASDETGQLLVDKSVAVNKIGHALCELDPAFAEFSYQPRYAGLLQQLGYVAPAFMQSMYIFKSPGTGAEVIPHCDHSFFWTEPPSVCALWFAVDDATRENGCLWAWSQGHSQDPKTRFRLVDAEDASRGTVTDVLDDTPYDKSKFVPLEVERGTLIVLHGKLPHFSDHNHSSEPRHAYTLHAIDTECDYLADNWLQRPGTLRLLDDAVGGVAGASAGANQ